jgi:hypothetical protein
VAVLAEEGDAGGVGDEGQSRDQNHQQGHGLAAAQRAGRNLGARGPPPEPSC